MTEPSGENPQRSELKIGPVTEGEARKKALLRVEKAQKDTVIARIRLAAAERRYDRACEKLAELDAEPDP
jgi:hypothetical protein